MTLTQAMKVSGAGMHVQTVRLNVVAQNIANVDTLPTAPGQEPYRRQVVTFRNALDREAGVQTVQIDRITTDDSSFKTIYDPAHPAADAEGYVLAPNVTTMIESMDMKEAQRAYDANLAMVSTARRMATRALDALSGN